ncbi:hypothetical protein M433DRAFT_247872 [Acidomyces richmondensis BFW]|nr:MAG: hypothetical protein FE78DRAFT_454636 [Acidomyces sp. 'richmondensis']KYG45588.1 hypothetical protein M433DRAFT_247872 [Acidomyces richmondensis BFW]
MLFRRKRRTFRLTVLSASRLRFAFPIWLTEGPSASRQAAVRGSCTWGWNRFVVGIATRDRKKHRKESKVNDGELLQSLDGYSHHFQVEEIGAFVGSRDSRC